MQEIWSNSDFVYMCLRDRKRTEAFQKAINEVVKPGDNVIEIGAGSGILSLFACTAGAARVTAVEIDPALADLVATSARDNGFGDRLSVLSGDGQDVDLPEADVVIAELIDTGLLDEQQLPVMNSLVSRGVITSRTRVIPYGYRTNLQLVTIDQHMYGFKITTLRHEWPFYARDTEWTDVSIEDASDSVVAWEERFDTGPHPTTVRREFGFATRAGTVINGLKISGVALLSPTQDLGACDTLNGDKVVPLPERVAGDHEVLEVSYTMGAGLGALSARWLDPH